MRVLCSWRCLCWWKLTDFFFFLLLACSTRVLLWDFLSLFNNCCNGIFFEILKSALLWEMLGLFNRYRYIQHQKNRIVVLSNADASKTCYVKNFINQKLFLTLCLSWKKMCFVFETRRHERWSLIKKFYVFEYF